MKVALINSFDERNQQAVAWQINQVLAGELDELWLATPHEDAVQIARDLGLELHQVFDLCSQSYLADQADGEGVWFYDLKVPNQGQLVVNKDWTKSISVAGHLVADVRWFANSNRLVQAVTWQNEGGQVDRKDIYQRNGRLFAKQYFSNGQLLQSDFYVGFDQMVCQDFYFQGMRNFVLDKNQRHYDSAENYLKHVMEKQGRCDVHISTVDRCLVLAPTGTTLALPQGVLDDQGNVWPDLVMVLTDQNHAVSRVLVAEIDREKLKKAGLPLDKVELLA
ncbi:glycosyltransferase [Fructobacillus tropaeoli]|uniref:glycosyltransferase n=1 Tax=Fructobacillus tropaeoli TaxID=709323 RepID=UPI001455E1A4|nr:glycosyltransferase [Fructobacillus tropaeoli]NLS38013.1 glycosyltransferase [Fructobacillus tropaeoli]